MHIQIPYGSTQRSIEVPKSATVIRSRETPALKDERAAFLAALRKPLASVPLKELVTPQDRIVTGFIEPHFFAGFSGGAKGIIPGLGGIQTIQALHNAELIGHPRSTWAI